MRPRRCPCIRVGRFVLFVSNQCWSAVASIFVSTHRGQMRCPGSNVSIAARGCVPATIAFDASPSSVYPCRPCCVVSFRFCTPFAPRAVCALSAHFVSPRALFAPRAVVALFCTSFSPSPLFSAPPFLVADAPRRFAPPALGGLRLPNSVLGGLRPSVCFVAVLATCLGRSAPGANSTPGGLRPCIGQSAPCHFRIGRPAPLFLKAVCATCIGRSAPCRRFPPSCRRVAPFLELSNRALCAFPSVSALARAPCALSCNIGRQSALLGRSVGCPCEMFPQSFVRNADF